MEIGDYTVTVCFPVSAVGDYVAELADVFRETLEFVPEWNAMEKDELRERATVALQVLLDTMTTDEDTK